MFETADHTDPGSELRARIEELATSLLLNGVTRDTAAGFRQLSDQVSRRGCPESARIASALAGRLSHVKDKNVPDEHSPALEKLVGNGLDQLRRALETESPKEASDAAGSNSHPAQAPSAMSLARDPELVGDFVLESREHLSVIESRMLTLERNPSEMEAIHEVFRGFHTIKGLAGFLDLADIGEVAHYVETLLDLARNGKLTIGTAVVDVVLQSADYLKQAIEAVGANRAGPEPAPGSVDDKHDLLLRIQRLTTENPANPASGESAPEPADPIPAAAKTVGAMADEARPESRLSVDSEPASPAPPRESPAKDARAKPAETFSVRVDTAKLDYLVEMVGEMVIAQALIHNNPCVTSAKDPRLLADLSQLARITGEVQRTTMGMRMIPIGQLFQRTGRIIRDLSRKAGKRVELETSGEHTELDKTIAEELSDPLMHMVRNAVDHGIETPEARTAAGKTAIACVRLAAYHQGGQIVVEVSDDGRGLGRDRILKKAQQKGLVEHGSRLSDTEIFNLIFEPGFSTAQRVTDISGRGVGLDVVRKHVQKLRGRIDIQSKAGQGTTFIIRLPLTLAIIEGLVVGVGGEHYIVPVFSVRELFRPTADSVSSIHERDEMVLVRGKLLPVVRLHRRFGVKPRSEDPTQCLMVVAESQGKAFCLMVDEVVGKQEVVIKNFGASLKNIGGIAGGAILGDGRVGLILDMDGVFGVPRP